MSSPRINRNEGSGLTVGFTAEGPAPATVPTTAAVAAAAVVKVDGIDFEGTGQGGQLGTHTHTRNYY